MKQGVSCIFNSMSFADRLALQAATAMKTITADFRDDTRQHPWKFPFYAAYVGIMLFPIPLVPGHGAVMAALVALYARAGVTPGARELHRRLREDFQQAALVENNSRYIEATPDGKHPFEVKKLRLTGHAAAQSLHNMRRMFDHAYSALGKLLMGTDAAMDTTFDGYPDQPLKYTSYELKVPENRANPPVP